MFALYLNNECFIASVFHSTGGDVAIWAQKQNQSDTSQLGTDTLEPDAQKS